jgi:hypothetical protein
MNARATARFSTKMVLIPISTFGDSAATHERTVWIKFRPFGQDETDLAVDFSSGARAALVTQLLEGCAPDHGRSLPPGIFRDLSIGKRLECLLALGAVSESPAFTFPFRCGGCQAQLEIELTLDELSEKQRESDQIQTVSVELNGKSVSLQKPTGRHQEEWARMAFGNETEAAAAMIRSLMTPPAPETMPLENEEIDVIDSAIDDADPLVNLACNVRCEQCGIQNQLMLDLCEKALEILQRLQQRLIVMVHQFASRYHWSEKEVFAAPLWRRTLYLELIAARR